MKITNEYTSRYLVLDIVRGVEEGEFGVGGGWFKRIWRRQLRGSEVLGSGHG
ncbi:hypothetical protein BVRB_4g084460 [Beta vulgaris subsp. vulgaris]|uniref:Uncharacterized protein n=1 Tax=Beta vulgaris subsp. vulgaris TaxID=3555 RepID=A0A0J8CI17_BETVV|nr:hypothetical protein BVRB_4g084460 [Beta vulgaris subsp. vulgaris]